MGAYPSVLSGGGSRIPSPADLFHPHPEPREVFRGLLDLVRRHRVDEVVELGPEPILLGQQLPVGIRLRHADQYGART
jgi:hypothetical protein